MAGLYGDVIQEIDASVGESSMQFRQTASSKTRSSSSRPTMGHGSAMAITPVRPARCREGKGTCWEGGVRVPCIMRWPGHIPANTHIDAMLMTIDLFPTIARLVGAALPKHPIDGLDVWPLLAGQPARPIRTMPTFTIMNRTSSRRSSAAMAAGSFSSRTPIARWRDIPGGHDGLPAILRAGQDRPAGALTI